MALAVVVAALLQSCESRIGESFSLTKTNLESQLSSKAELLIDNMADMYGQIQDIAFESQYDGVVAGILSSSAETFVPSELTSDTIRLKTSILNLYKQAMHEYSLLSDAGFSGKPNSFAKSCNLIVEAYGKLNDSIAKACGRQLVPLVRTVNYDQNYASILLIDALAAVWNKDVDTWVKQLNTAFLDYQTSLSMVPDEAFDESKLIKYVNAPYNGKHNLAEVYKLNLIKERRATLNALVQRQHNISTSLQYLQEALAEFVKKNGENEVVMNYIKRIELLLDNRDSNNE